MSTRKTVGIAALSLGLGFVAGAWSISSDFAIRMLLVKKVPPAVETDNTPAAAPVKPPVPAVAVPKQTNFSGGSGGLGKKAERFDLIPTLGCEWAIDPHPFLLGRTWHSTNPERTLGGYSSADGSGGLNFLLIESTHSLNPDLPLRPVFFDAQAKPYVPHPAGKGSSRGPDGLFLMEEFHLNSVYQIPAEKVAFFGVERVLPDSARLIAEAARREAKEKGIEILPPPEVGKPYAIDLPAADGSRVRSADLRGKAVVLATYGPGSGGFALQMLGQLRKSYTPSEVAFVGVSFDGSAEDARRDLARYGVDVTLVVVRNDAETRRIWIEGAGLDRLPRLLLIDRDGTLRDTCTPFELRDRVDVLMGRAKPTPRPVVVKVPSKSERAPAAPPGPASDPRPQPPLSQ